MKVYSFYMTFLCIIRSLHHSRETFNLFCLSLKLHKWHFCFATHRKAFMLVVLLSWNYKAIVSSVSWKHNRFQNYWHVSWNFAIASNQKLWYLHVWNLHAIATSRTFPAVLEKTRCFFLSSVGKAPEVAIDLFGCSRYCK